MPPASGDTPSTGPQPAQIVATLPNVSFLTNQVPPSQYLYLQQNDLIGGFVLSNYAGATITAKYRYLTPKGEIKEGTFLFTTGVGAIGWSFGLDECWLLGIQFTTGLGSSPNAWAFVTVSVTRFSTSVALQFGHTAIWEGYIFSVVSRGWPGQPAQNLTDGAGFLHSITGTTPAAGADISETVPANRRWNLLAFRSTLTASAAVANRNVTLVTDDGSNILFRGTSYVNQTAGQVQAYSALSSTPQPTAVSGDFLIVAPLPLPQKAAFRIRTSTTNLQAGDQWTAPQYLVQEWGIWDT
jgi:hypothetical protein